MPATHCTVRVPASSANLGPGFDTLGMALQLYNRMAFEVTEGPVTVEVSGEGEGLLAGDAANLAYASVLRVYAEAGESAPALRIRMWNRIPVSRGLGSSSTAIVGGLVAGNALLGSPFDRERLLRLAVELEGHADNVAPALYGGFQVSAAGGDEPAHLSLPVPAGLRAVVCIPSVAVSTADARRVLPAEYSRTDAVFNTGRVALLVSALLTGRIDLLRTAMQDRIHQPYRASLIPGFDAALAGALAAGAAGACLSGSGSTMLALVTGAEEAVGEAMVAAVRREGADARWLALDVDTEGAALEEAEPEEGAPSAGE